MLTSILENPFQLLITTEKPQFAESMELPTNPKTTAQSQSLMMENAEMLTLTGTNLTGGCSTDLRENTSPDQNTTNTTCTHISMPDFK